MIKIQVSGHKYKTNALQKELRKIASQIPKQVANEMEKKVKESITNDISAYSKTVYQFMVVEYKKEIKEKVKELAKAEFGFERWLASEMAKVVKVAIDEQRWNWAPLSETYKAWKIRKGLDPRILIAYGYYINSIKAYRSGNDYVVGVDPFQIHPETGIRLQKLARYLEYGTRKMPPRPHWRPAYEYVRKNINRYVKKWLKAKLK